MRSGRWEGDTERLYAMEARLLLERFPPPAGLEVRTAWLADQPNLQGYQGSIET